MVDFIPLDALLPSCSATVHRGGFGTAQNALVHGAPQVVVPNDPWDFHPRAELISPDPLLSRSPWDTGPGAEPGAGKDRVPPALSASQGTGRRAQDALSHAASCVPLISAACPVLLAGRCHVLRPAGDILAVGRLDLGVHAVVRELLGDPLVALGSPALFLLLDDEAVLVDPDVDLRLVHAGLLGLQQVQVPVFLHHGRALVALQVGETDRAPVVVGGTAAHRFTADVPEILGDCQQRADPLLHGSLDTPLGVLLRLFPGLPLGRRRRLRGRVEIFHGVPGLARYVARGQVQHPADGQDMGTTGSGALRLPAEGLGLGGLRLVLERHLGTGLRLATGLPRLDRPVRVLLRHLLQGRLQHGGGVGPLAGRVAGAVGGALALRRLGAAAARRQAHDQSGAGHRHRGLPDRLHSFCCPLSDMKETDGDYMLSPHMFDLFTHGADRSRRRLMGHCHRVRLVPRGRRHPRTSDSPGAGPIKVSVFSPGSFGPG
ncbi:nucleotide disphospho-sugar-binding domain-containing protein [Streptomyces celluloflavus]|uniref:nucleotide disphospho-sugar-binding domain-containing protein n=1 Tax=Streptomyces celluloflavus TaxID=58344 RepID=UPI00367B2782